jgi:hypothetical protein
MYRSGGTDASLVAKLAASKPESVGAPVHPAVPPLAAFEPRAADTARQAAFAHAIPTSEAGRAPRGVVRILTQNMHARPINRWQSHAEIQSEVGGWRFAANRRAAWQKIMSDAVGLATCDPATNFDNAQLARSELFARAMRGDPALNVDRRTLPQVICLQEAQDESAEIIDRILTEPKSSERPVLPFRRALCSLGDDANGYPMTGECLAGGPVGGLVRGYRVLTTGAGEPVALKAAPGGIATYVTSGWEIVEQRELSFEGGPGPDFTVNKGAIITTIRATWAGARGAEAPQKVFHVVNMHPSAPITDHTIGVSGCVRRMNCSIWMVRRDAIRQLRLVRDWVAGELADARDEPVFFCGDMNINRYTALWETQAQETPSVAAVVSGEEFNRMLTELSAEQPPCVVNPQPIVPAGGGRHGVGHGGVFSWDGSENAITKNPLWPESYTWIDYVLLSREHAAPLYADNSIYRTYLETPVKETGDFYKEECEAWRARKKFAIWAAALGDAGVPTSRASALASSSSLSDAEKAALFGSIADAHAETHPVLARLTGAAGVLAEINDREGAIRALLSRGGASTEVALPGGAGVARVASRSDGIDEILALRPSIVDLKLLHRIFSADAARERRARERSPLTESDVLFHDVADHYGVMATVIFDGIDAATDAAHRKLMAQRLDTSFTDPATGLPGQPRLPGLASRLVFDWDEFAPGATRDLWMRMTAGVGLFHRDRAAEILNLRVEARRRAAWAPHIGFLRWVRLQSAIGRLEHDANPAAWFPTYANIVAQLGDIFPEMTHATQGDLRAAIADADPASVPEYVKKLRLLTARDAVLSPVAAPSPSAAAGAHSAHSIGITQFCASPDGAESVNCAGGATRRSATSPVLTLPASRRRVSGRRAASGAAADDD